NRSCLPPFLTPSLTIRRAGFESEKTHKKTGPRTPARRLSRGGCNLGALSVVTASSTSSLRGVDASIARAPRLDVAVFRTGSAIIALHIADDNFFEPARGVSSADHIFSGLVPLAALFAAAAAYPRLRPGLQATL